MLRCEVVRKRDRRFHPGHAQHAHLGRELALHQPVDFSGDRRIGADQDGARDGDFFAGRRAHRGAQPVGRQLGIRVPCEVRPSRGADCTHKLRNGIVFP